MNSNIEQIHSFSDRLRNNIGRVIIGKEAQINLVLSALLAGGHVLLEDVPGTGKTMLAKTLARSIDGGFKRVQFTPDLLPSDLTGLNVYSQKDSAFHFVSGPVFTNILLADEINRATPRTQSSLLECMEERQVTVDGETRILDAPFFVIATQNPIETAGTFPLPEAQTDRFLMQLSLGFPAFEEEVRLLDRFLQDDPLSELSPVCTLSELVTMQQMVKEVFVHPSIRSYIVTLVRNTRDMPGVALGAGPRGTLSLLGASRSYAALCGRDYIVPEDVKFVAPSVLSHRILTDFSHSEAGNAGALVASILENTPVPTEDFKRR